MGTSQSQPKEEVDTQTQADPIQNTIETTPEIVSQEYTPLDWFWPVL